MKPTLEQIKTDESVWPENATNYNEINKRFYILGDTVQVQESNGEWLKINIQPESIDDYIGMIARPAKAFVPEVGAHLEATWWDKIDWYECVILPMRKIAIFGGSEATCNDDEVMLIEELGNIEFRPIKSEREKFSEAVDSLIKPHHCTAIDIGEALYDSGKFKLVESGK